MWLSRHKGRQFKPDDCLARYLVTKKSWRGSYPRILLLCVTGIDTQDPAGFRITNSYRFDADVESISIGSDAAEFILSVRQDSKSKSFKPARFTCRHRAQLLTDLYQCIAAAASVGQCATASRLLGSNDHFQAQQLVQGAWQLVTLRVTAYSLEVVPAQGGSSGSSSASGGPPSWRMDYSRMASPAFTLLQPAAAAPGAGGGAGGEAAWQGQPPEGLFAVPAGPGKPPAVFACRQREALLRQALAQARQRVGCELQVDATGAVTVQQLHTALSRLDVETSLQPGAAPIGQWQVAQLAGRHDVVPPALAQCSRQMQCRGAGPPTAEGAALEALAAPGANLQPRYLLLTPSALLERTVDSYETVNRRPLGLIAALLRFAHEPKLLGVEWSDGSPPSLYMSGDRENILAVMADAAAAAAGRPIPLLPGFTAPGDALVAGAQARGAAAHGSAAAAAAAAAHCAAVEHSPLVERWLAEELASRAKDAAALLAAAGRLHFSADAEPGRQRLALGKALGNSGGAAGGGSGGVAAADLQAVKEALQLVMETVYETNACIAYSGVVNSSAANALDEMAMAGIVALLPEEVQPGLAPAHMGMDAAKQAVAVLACLQRLSTAPLVAHALLMGPGTVGRIFACIACGEDAVVLEAVQLCTRLWCPGAARVGAAPWRVASSRQQQASSAAGVAATDSPTAAATAALAPAPGSHALSAHASSSGANGSSSGPSSQAHLNGGSASWWEQSTPEEMALARVAKAACFTAGTTSAHLQLLLGLLKREPPAPPLVSMAAVEALAALVCQPGAKTTDARLQALVTEQCAALGRPLFELFSHPAPRVCEGAALLMRCVAEGGAAAAAPMREAALREGALLRHLITALFATGEKSSLSQELVAYWVDEFAPAIALLRRSLPPGLLRFLQAPQQQQQAATLEQKLPQPMSAAAAVSAAPAAGDAAAGLAAASGSSASNGEATDSGGQPATAPVLDPLSAPSRPGGAPQPQQPLAQQARPDARPAPPAVADPLGINTSTASPAPTPATAGSEQQTAAATQLGVGAVAAHGSAAAEGAAAAGPLAATATLALPPAVATAAAPGGLKGNWAAFWAAATRDHRHAGLIWNQRTRAELREALQAEEDGLRLAKQKLAQGSGGAVSWNHREFGVEYPSLSKELSIGSVYVRLLLDGTGSSGGKEAGAAAAAALTGGGHDVDQRLAKVPNPKEFFTALHYQFLCAGSSDVRSGAAAARGADQAASAQADAKAMEQLCVDAMAALYHVHAGVVGPVRGVQHLVDMGDLTTRVELRHALLQLLQALIQPRCASGGAGPAGGGSGNAATRQAAQAAARANGYALLDAGGVQLLLDFVVGCHNSSSDYRLGSGAPAVAAGHLLTGFSHAEAPKEWSYLVPPPPAAANAAGEEGAMASGTAVAGLVQVGPVSKAEIRSLYAAGTIDLSTPFQAHGMSAPLPLGAIRELRWLVASCSGSSRSTLDGVAAARIGLQCLQQLVALQPAADELGRALQPAPRVMRTLTSPACLPHICQVLLCGEPQLVSLAAQLLQSLLEHNAEALSRLYLSGVFYFGLAYSGSNVLDLARLLKLAHLKQAFRGPQDAASAQAGLPLSVRSYLGHLLPESLLYVLEGGPEAFARALVGDADTPELIWTHAMRGQRLVPQLLQHLGDLPYRLAENNHVLYDYAPLPPVKYPEIADEVWCHRYYIRNMCDEVSFPHWPIVEHVPILQALLAEWRAELARQPLSLSEADACAVLGLEPPPGGGAIPEDAIRRAYRGLARKYHPDKNPSAEARKRFLELQAAYERLQAGAAGGQGPQPWRIALLLQAQAILYRRYPRVLAPFKYAGYQQLMEVVAGSQAGMGAKQPPQRPAQSAAAPNGGRSAAAAAAAPEEEPEQGKQTQALQAAPPPPPPYWLGDGDGVKLVTQAIELCWLTCIASRPNAEELMRCGGIATLGGLLQRCVGVLPKDALALETQAVIATNTLRTFAGLAAVPAARADLAVQPQLVADIVRCVALERAPAAVDAALVAIAHMAAAEPLQQLLLRCGALAYVVPLLLGFDPTQEAGITATFTLPFGSQPAGIDNHNASGSGHDTDNVNDVSLRVLDSALARENMTVARSYHAVLAVQALGRLAGVLQPPHSTPPCPPAQAALQALLTPNMAARLADGNPVALLQALNSTQETPLVVWSAAQREELLALLAEQRSAAGAAAAQDVDATAQLAAFRYTKLAKELFLAGVYVRVYAAQPAALPAAQAPDFCKALVRFLHEQLVEAAGRGAALGAVPAAARRDVLLALHALQLLLEREPRLTGLLASKSAVQPVLAGLAPAAATWRASPFPSPEHADSLAAVGGPGVEHETIDQLACGCLQLLLRLAQHAPGLEAIADESSVQLAFWLLYSPTSPTCLLAALQLLRALLPHPMAGWAAAGHGGALYLLHLLLHPEPFAWPQQRQEGEGAEAGGRAGEAGRVSSSRALDDQVKTEAASLLSRFMAQASHGPRIVLMLERLLPAGLVAALQEGPGDAVAAALSQTATETPECLWDVHMAGQASAALATLLDGVRAAQAGGAMEVSLPAGWCVDYPKLRGELWVGGVYVRLYLQTPSYPLRQPKQFMQGLLDRYLQLLATIPLPSAGGGGGSGGGSAAHAADSNAALLVSAAAVALLKHHALLADSMTQAGYMPKLLAALATRTSRIWAARGAAAVSASTATAAATAAASASLPFPPGGRPVGVEHMATPAAAAAPAAAVAPPGPDEIGGSILRLLHQLSAATSAAEALAACSAHAAVATLLAAATWGQAATVLVLETLKRLLAPANRQRDLLVLQALQVDLLTVLLRILDWRVDAQAASILHTEPVTQEDVSVQRAQTVDVLQLLAEDGEHCLTVRQVLDGSEVWKAYRGQRHDLYLPRGAAAEGSVVGLLTGAAAKQFALPAPEAVSGGGGAGLGPLG